ncbi:MAG: hypothetical protein KDA37_16245 [Planctomycetales bacterium]|nr:hypothetical protein [Planctomycetales bacterium]
MTDLNQFNEAGFQALIARLCDGVLTDEEMIQLDQWISDIPDARASYLEHLDLHGRLTWDCGFPSRAAVRTDALSPSQQSVEAGGAAATPGATTSTKRTQATLRGAERRRDTRSSTTLSTRTAYGWLNANWVIGAAAAVVLAGAVLLARSDRETATTAVLPADHTEPRFAVQATFTRATNLDWGGPMATPHLGARPGTHLMQLRGGQVQMTFDNGVEVVIQGPAEFAHDGFGNMALSYGLLTAKVPSRAGGFSLVTTSARVASGGASTFGAVVESNGQTEVHVLDGAVNAELLTDHVHGTGPRRGSRIGKASALRLDRESESISTIPCDDYLFDKVNSHCLDVVDLIAGGNGFSDRIAYGIDAFSGRRLLAHEPPSGTRKSDEQYHLVEWNDRVDGVFVPTSSKKGVQLDSSGVAYHGFPTASGKSWQGGITLHRSGLEQPVAQDEEGVFNWLQSRDPEAFSGMTGAYLGMHANCGITFDLNRIDDSLSEGHLRQFHASLLHLRPERPGESVARPPVLWVFLDGRLFASYRPSGNHTPVEVEVALAGDHRFLTLVSTDGDGSIDEDWIVLANPLLTWVAISPDEM